MELLKVEDAASIMLFDLRVSESALQCFADTLNYMLKNIGADELHKLYFEDEFQDYQTPEDTREFIQNLHNEIMDLIKIYCKDEYLQKRFREWIVQNHSGSE